MDKKKVAVIALILFLGLGTFVFANPSEVSKEKTTIEDGYNETNDKYHTTEEEREKKISENNTDMITDMENEKAIKTFIRDNMNVNTAIDFITEGSNSGINNSNPGGEGNTGNNNGNPSEGNNNDNSADGNTEDKEDNKPINPDPSNPSEGETTDPEKPDLPENPDNDKEEIKEQYEQLKKLITTLKSKVENAKSKEDIIEAKKYRDNNNIIKLLENLKNEELKQELLNILTPINIILNDETKPVIHGAVNKKYYKEDVTLTIEEENIKEIKVNGKPIPVDKTVQFIKEGKYEVTVIDAAFNKTTITFTIDKTAPSAIVTTSNNGMMTNEDVIVYINVNEAVKPIDGWLLATDKKSLSKVFKENTKASLIIEDLAGNQTTVNYEVFDINREVPNVIENGIHYSITTLTNGDVVVTITTDKDIFTPAGWEMVSGSRVFTKTYKENTKEKVPLKDGYKNIGYVTIEITNIDKTPPVATFIIDSEKTNQTIIGKIVANEPIKEVKGWISSTNKCEIMKAFDENVEDSVIIEDLAGNQTVVKYVVKNIDKEVSDIKVTTSNNGKPTNKDVIVTISSSEELEAVEGWILAQDQKSLSKIFSANIKSSVVITDKIGNQQIVEYEVFDIDKTPPEVTEIEYSLTSDNEILVTIKTEKAIFTPNGWKMVKNSQVFTKVYKESTTETIRLKDAYRNRINFVITVDIEEIRKMLLANNQKSISANQMMNAVSPVLASVLELAKNIIS